jgi:hypothetical protein
MMAVNWTPPTHGPVTPTPSGNSTIWGPSTHNVGNAPGGWGSGTGTGGADPVTGPPGTTPGPGGINPTTGTPQQNMDEYQHFIDTLGGVDALSTGMVDLIKQAYDKYKQGVPLPDIMDFIRTSAAYKARYPGIADAWKRGYPMKENEYQSVEKAMQEKMRDYGIDLGTFGTRDQLGKIIGAGVSSFELDSRLAVHQQATLASVDPASRKWMADTYGITDGDLTGFWLNPDQMLPAMLAKANSSITGGAAASQGFNISAQEAEHLASLGTKAGQPADWQQYAQAAGQAGIARQFTGTIGQNESIDQNTLLDATMGNDATAIAATKRVQAARTAEFEQRGGYAMGQGGVTGLGSANK